MPFRTGLKAFWVYLFDVNQIQAILSRLSWQARFMRRHSDSGFTIIEVVIVIACIAVLAAIAAPKMSGFILQAHLDGAKPYLQELATKQRMYKIENGTYCCSTSTTDENNLATTLGLSVANAGDLCIVFVCRDATICQTAMSNAFISPIASGVPKPDFEIWALLRNTSSGTVTGPGNIVC